MPENHAGRLQVGGHQHRRPESAMETGDILADKVDVRRPPGSEPFLVAAVADPRDVRQQSVEPDPDGELRIERDLNAPGLADAGDVDVLEAGLDEGQHLIPPAFRLNEVRVLLVETQKTILEA